MLFWGSQEEIKIAKIIRKPWCILFMDKYSEEVSVSIVKQLYFNKDV